MNNEKHFIICEETYHKHIDKEVHLYGLLHQLAFLADKVNEPDDVEHFQDTAIRYGQIANDIFEDLNIPGRYLVYGNKSDLAALKERELAEVLCVDECAEEETASLRDTLENILCFVDDLSDTLAEALEELETLESE
jgi:hypothetical protein